MNINKKMRNPRILSLIMTSSLLLFAGLIWIGYQAQRSAELEFLIRHGLQALTSQHYELALAQFSDATTKHPTSRRAYLYQAITNARLQNYPEAEKLINKAIELGTPDDLSAGVAAIIAIAQKDFNGATEYLEKLPHDVADQDLKNLLTGMILKGQNNFQRATEVLRPVADSKDNFLRATALHEIAYIDFANHKFSSALELLNKSIDAAPSVLAYQHRADTNRKLKHYANAIADYSKAMELSNNKRSAALHYWRAICETELHRYSEAAADMKTVLHIEPNFADATARLRDIYKHKDTTRTK